MRAVLQERDLVGEQDRRGAVGHDQAGGGARAPGAAPPRRASRCGRRARTACRRGPAPWAGRAPRGRARGAGADRRTATCPARRCGCRGPRAGRGRSPAWAMSSASWISSSVASARPSVRFSRALIENSVGSSNAVATSGAELLERVVADVDAVDRDPAAGHVVQPGDQRGQRGLAGAGGADQRERLARAQVEVDVAQHRGVGAGEGEVDVLEAQVAQGGRRRSPCRRRWSGGVS